MLEGPWNRHHNLGGQWFDPDVAAVENGALTGGERRVLAIAASLASSDRPFDFSAAIVLAALGYACRR